LILLGFVVRSTKVVATHVANPTLHAIAEFLPIVPIALFGIAGLRLYWGLDEMVRRRVIVGMAGGVWLWLLVNMTYRYVPDTYLPPLPPGEPVLVVCIVIVALVMGLRDSLSEMPKPK